MTIRRAIYTLFETAEPAVPKHFCMSTLEHQGHFYVHAARLAKSVPRTVVHEQKPGQVDAEPGVAFGANFWPPKPFTEHGAPNPEDDPANYEGE